MAPRAALWVGAAGVDLLGGVAGFYTPGLDRSVAREWTIEGGHFAERCQAFVLIALGESIVVIGAALSGLAHVGVAEIAAFAVALVGSAGLWWLYFDRSAAEGARIIAASDDPGRLGRSAYHLIHPIMIAGIIVFLARHSAVKAVIWRRASWPRLGALAVLGLLGLAAPHVTAVALGACTAVVIIAVAVLDYARNRRLPGEAAGRPTTDTSRKVREIDRHINDCGLCAVCGSRR